mmetsp:Transcript_34275/g.79073  ORF Transcript_34275/g.79073 Transcript_34275/m.79073 type:complete len:102 (+) Transcript_34275:481-786(+)
MGSPCTVGVHQTFALCTYAVLPSILLSQNYVHIMLAMLFVDPGCVGDLYFSAIKRRLGIKDYSRALSSHGGFLDRVDSFIFAANALVWKAVLGSRWTSSSS